MHGWDTGLSLGQVLDQPTVSNILSEQIREEMTPKMFILNISFLLNRNRQVATIITMWLIMIIASNFITY